MMPSVCQQLKRAYEELVQHTAVFAVAINQPVTPTLRQQQKELFQAYLDVIRISDPYQTEVRFVLAQRLGLQNIGVFTNEGLAWVKKDNKYFFIKPDGSELSSERYDSAWDFSNGVARV